MKRISLLIIFVALGFSASAHARNDRAYELAFAELSYRFFVKNLYPEPSDRCKRIIRATMFATVLRISKRKTIAELHQAGCLDRYSGFYDLAGIGPREPEHAGYLGPPPIGFPSVTAYETKDGLYIRITSFVRSETGVLFRRVLQRSKPRKIYIDLRGNLGGNLLETKDVLDNFSPHVGAPYYTEVEREKTTVVRTSGTGAYQGVPLIILVDRRTASASELLAGTLQYWHTKTVTILGECTYGKGLIQWTPPSVEHLFMRITTGEYYIGEGAHARKMHGIGLCPNRPIPPNL